MFGHFPITLPKTVSHLALSSVSQAADRSDTAVAAIDLAAPGAALRTSGAQIMESSVGVEGPEMKVRFGGKMTWLYQTFASPVDWSSVNLVIFTVKNEEAYPVTFGAAVSSSSDPSNLSQAFNAPFTVGAGEKKRIALVLRDPDLAGAGLRQIPAPSGDPVFTLRSSGKVDTSRIGHWRLSYQGTAPARVTFSEIALQSYKPGFPKLSDEFGQFTGRDWTGKIESASDFADRLAVERNDLVANPVAPTLYGSSALPNQGVGGWRIYMVNGKRYFITPSGKPMWMTGLVGVHDWMATMIDGRSQMFTDLPSTAGETADLYEYHVPSRGAAGTMFYTQRSNLRQKYGRNYTAPFIAHLKKRLPSWGFNTVGAMSTSLLYDNSTPFTMLVDTNAFPTRLQTPMIDWKALPDPYAPNFASWTVAKLVTDLGRRATYSNLMGVFVDNEMSWGKATAAQPDGDLSVATGALDAPATQPARIVFLSQLTARYATISRLNTAWGTSFASFANVRSAATLGRRPNAAMRADCQAFVGSFAESYFSKVDAALVTAGYRGLYLGCRFNVTNDQVIAAASKYVDTLSFNIYARAGDVNWAYYNGLSKSVLISEFGFAHADGSGFAGNPIADTTAIRATWTNEFLRAAAQQRNIVGVQYYEYGEHPVTGVADTQENYSYGMVDIADNPEMRAVNVFRQFAKDLYTVRG